jgi:hypothetical protein
VAAVSGGKVAEAYGAYLSSPGAAARDPTLAPFFSGGSGSGGGGKGAAKNGSSSSATLAFPNAGLPDPSSPGAQYLAWDWGRAGWGGGGDRALNPPYPAVTFDVRRDFGAVGDGKADDTAAFLRAVAAVASLSSSASRAGAPASSSSSSSAPPSVLYVPEGTYKIRQRLVFTSRVVVRGAGRAKTTLLFPSSLSEAAAAEQQKQQKAGGGGKSNTTTKAAARPLSSSLLSLPSSFPPGRSPYAYGSPSWISFEGPPAAERAAAVAELSAASLRDSRLLTLRSTSGLKQGDRVVLMQGPTATELAAGGKDGSSSSSSSGKKKAVSAADPAAASSSDNIPEFLQHVLFRGQPLPEGAARAHPAWSAAPLRLSTTITRVINATHAEVDRALPFEASPLFGARLVPADLAYPHTMNALEHLTVAFPWTPYQGPGNEPGYNAVSFFRAQHSWVRSVAFANADASLALRDVAHFSVVGARFLTGRAGRHATPASRGYSAGRALSARGSSSDVLLHGLDFKVRAYVDVSLGAHAAGVAVASSRGTDLSVVPEGGPAGPLATLVTAADFGEATRPWGSPGKAAAAAGWTLWNAWAGPPSESEEAAALDGAKGTSLPLPPGGASAFGPGVVFFSTRLQRRLPQQKGVPLPWAMPAGAGTSSPSSSSSSSSSWLVSSADEPFGVRAWPPDLAAAMRQAVPSSSSLSAASTGRWDPLPSSALGTATAVPAPPSPPLLRLVGPGVGDDGWGPVVAPPPAPPPSPPPTPQQRAAREAGELMAAAVPSWRRAADEARALADALEGKASPTPPPVPIQPLLPVSLALSSAASGKPPAAMPPWPSTEAPFAASALRRVASEIDKGPYACDKAKAKAGLPAEQQKCCVSPSLLPTTSGGGGNKSTSAAANANTTTTNATAPLPLLVRPQSPSDCPPCPGTDFGVPSALYGCAGELWSPYGRLTDWSWAGVAFGAGPPSRDALPPTEDFRRDWGAKGDGVADDTDAFLRALQTVDKPKVVAAGGAKKNVTGKPAVATTTAAAAAPSSSARKREAGIRQEEQEEEEKEASTPSAAASPADTLLRAVETTRGEPKAVTYASWSVDPTLTLLLEAGSDEARAVVAATRTPARIAARGGKGGAALASDDGEDAGALFRGTMELLSAEGVGENARAAHEEHGAAVAPARRRGQGQPRLLSELALEGTLGSPASREDDFASAASGGATFVGVLRKEELEEEEEEGEAAAAAAASNHGARSGGGLRSLLEWTALPSLAASAKLPSSSSSSSPASTSLQLSDLVESAAATAAAAAGVRVGSGGSGSARSGARVARPSVATTSAAPAAAADLPENLMPMLVAGAAHALEVAASARFYSPFATYPGHGPHHDDEAKPPPPQTPTPKKQASAARAAAPVAPVAPPPRPAASNTTTTNPPAAPAPASTNNTTNTTTRVLYLPPGRYLLKKKVDTRISDFILRGAGPEKTTIFVPLSLTQAYGNAYREGGGCCASDYSHGTGFLNFFGWDSINPWNEVATVVRPAKRGDRRLYVNSTGGDHPDGLEAAMRAGRPVRFAMDGDTRSLLRDLKGGYFEPTEGEMKGAAVGKVVRLLTRVVAVGRDDDENDQNNGTTSGSPWIELERPLTTNVSLSWKPRFHRHEPTSRFVGVEDLTIEFPWKPFAGHLKEDGYNALHFNQVADGWVRNVKILNADAGVYFWGTQSCEISEVELRATRPRGNMTNLTIGNQNGHRGVWIERGADNLVASLNVSDPYTHDATVSTAECGTVIARSRGADFNVDHHRSAPFANLFTRIDAGRGNRPLESSGDARNGPHSAAWPTYWGVRGERPFYYPPLVGGRSTPGWFAPLAQFVGFRAAEGSRPPEGVGAMGWWAEGNAPRAWPEDLHESMRRTRAERYARLEAWRKEDAAAAAAATTARAAPVAAKAPAAAPAAKTAVV